MQKTSRLNRLLAVLVAVFMAVCCLPLNAFAEVGHISDGRMEINVFYYDEEGNSKGSGIAMVPLQNFSDKETGKGMVNANDMTGVPEGYEICSTGDYPFDNFNVTVTVRPVKEEPTQPETPEKPTEVIMNFAFIDENGNNVGGGDQFVPNTGTANYNVLDLPEGYELVETGDFFVEEGKSLTVKVKKTVTSQTVGLNFYDETSEEQICEVEVELPADAIHMNTNDMLDYLPEGYDFVVTGDLAINDGWIYVGVKPTKTLRIYWAIDNGDAADFADGSADTWTQELTWKHIHDEIALPQITVADGYVFNGWSVSGQNGEFWGPELKTMTVGDKFVADEKGGVISIIANIVTREAGQGGSTGGNNGGSTGSSEQSGATATAASAGNDTVVKTAAPADNSVKILPQTGFTAEAPAVFGGMLFAALAGAGAYLFGMRKKLNETF